MTHFVVTFVFVLLVNSAISLKCPEGTTGIACLGDNEATSVSSEISTLTAEPLPRPEALNMMAEEEGGDDELVSHPTFHLKTITTTIPSTTLTTSTETVSTKNITNSTDEPKGRAINFNLKEHNNENGLTANSSKIDDLSDVSMDGDEDEREEYNEQVQPKIISNKSVDNITLFGHSCILGGLTYDNGEKLENGCDSICTCTAGKMVCTDRCENPYLKKGLNVKDPLCLVKDVEDPCCSILICETNTAMEEKNCSHKNKTYSIGDKIEDGCDSICTCEVIGNVSCTPRCTPISKTSDRCVEVPDPTDSCCKKILCDVTLDDHEPEKEEELKQKILTAKYINSTTIQIELEINSDKTTVIEVSSDKISWKAVNISSDGYLNIANNIELVRLKHSDDIVKVFKSASKEFVKGCGYKGRQLKILEEFNDNCTSLCVCRENGVQCFKMDCPTYFGVDVLNPQCIEWETEPPNFVPSPPNCCPTSIKCKSNGSCVHENILYNNWQEISSNITGCDKKCYCEMGKVECQNICPPVTALPPPDLQCTGQEAVLESLPFDDCCLHWICKPKDSTQGLNEHLYPGGFINIPPGFQQPQDDIIIHTLDAIDAHTVRLAFSVPPVIVGLHGRVEVRYTYKTDNDPNMWERQVFAPPNDLIETPQLEFDLLGLKEDREYRIKITVLLRDLQNTPSSRIYSVKTLKDVPSTTLPPMIPIEPNLEVTDVNSSWVNVAWRKFTDYELQFIDGVQIRYKEIDGKIYAATPLIHRAVTNYILDNLKPNTKYEAGIFLIPFPGQTSELHAEHMIHFTTANEFDNYGFNVTLEINHIKTTSIEITWSGVPYPEDKYVNIYRAIYQSDSGKGDFSTFKVAKRDSPPKTTITDLKPGVRYRLWLEVYLTNGRIKTSNVQDFITKPRPPPTLGASTLQGKLEAGDLSEQKGDYYGPLVIVAILATIAILSTLILLLILVKRHSQNKAAITTPVRVSQSAYDNPTYKVEIQQETMDL